MVGYIRLGIIFLVFCLCQSQVQMLVRILQRPQCVAQKY